MPDNGFIDAKLQISVNFYNQMPFFYV